MMVVGESDNRHWVGVQVLGGEGWHEEEQGIGRAEGGRE